jgi:hypothetical protein
MNDVATIVVVHISRQQRQSLLYVGQELRLKAKEAEGITNTLPVRMREWPSAGH